MPKTEDRRVERYQLKLAAYLSVVDSDAPVEKNTISLNTSDISSGGAFFGTGTPLPVGTEVKIDIVLPLDQIKNIEGENAKIEVSGAVVRIDKGGMGVCFDEEYKITKMS